MKHIPHSSRIFIGLLIITLLMSYIAITLSYYQERYILQDSVAMPIQKTTKVIAEPVAPADTTDWVKYVDPEYPIAFSHPKDWKIKTANVGDDFYDITLDIPNTAADMHVYASIGMYYGFDGLIQKPYSLGKLNGVKVNDNLIGIKTGEYYYTFDGSMNNALLPEFTALMKTVNFETAPVR